MRKSTFMGALALALCSAVLWAGVSFAANTITVKVLQKGQPVQGASVEVLASDGSAVYTTNQSGTITADLTGKVFRLKVNNLAQAGLHSVSEHSVTISLN